MIKRLRKRFILICTFSFLAVFVIMMAGIYVSNTVRQTKRFDLLADILSENCGSFPEPKAVFSSSSRPIAEFITPDTPFTTRYFTVTFSADGSLESSNIQSISDISEAEAESMGREILQKGTERGWKGDFRYKLYETDGKQQVIFISAVTHMAATRDYMLSTVKVFGLGSLAVLVLIIFLSRFAVRTAEESDRKQKQFITDANHELKTPLTLILTNIDIAESELGQNEWLDDIRTEGERMGKLVNRLVTLSRMDEEKEAGCSGEFLLSDTVQESVSEFEELAAMCGKELSAEIMPDLHYTGNEPELRQLTAILLDNAVKYCDAGGAIHVQLRRKKHIMLTVTNACRDVDSIQLDRLFDRFYREDTARTAGSGFGIGLSIAQSIVERHKGSIKAEKAAEGEIRFTVRL